MLKNKVWLSVCIITALMLFGCGNLSVEQKEAARSNLAGQDTLGLKPDFSYSFTQQTPSIIIDKVGYLPDRKKAVYITGKHLSKEFTIYNAMTKEKVYSGSLKKVRELEDGKELYVGDFTNLTMNGIYKIYQEQVGYSYSFTINKAVYRNVSNQLIEEAEEYQYKNTSDLCYSLANMMLINEIYPTSQISKDFIAQSTKKLLLQQEQKTGAVSQMIGQTQNTEMRSLSATAIFAGVLAQYYYNYKDLDLQLAKDCLNASLRAYQYIENYRDNVSPDCWYYAATQLYRITGHYRYRMAIAEYDKTVATLQSVSEYDFTMMADIAYLTTTYHTELLRCEGIMDQYMDRAQEISLKSSSDYFYVDADIDKKEEKEVLKDMKMLGVVNYVLSGREYSGIQENYIHYLLGSNIGKKNRLTEQYTTQEMKEPMNQDITKVADFIFILSYVSKK